MTINDQTSTGTTSLIDLDALGTGDDYRARKVEVIADTTGTPVARLSMVPPLFVTRAVAAQRRAKPLPLAQRSAALAEAAEIFRTGTIAGLDFDEYVAMVSAVSGLPIAVARDGARSVAEAMTTARTAVDAAMPAGTVLDWRDERSPGGVGVWARRGEIFAVHASGNAPAVHGAWPQALALGYRVAVRPSRREPFTGHRVIRALRQAGFRNEDAVYLPTDYTGADEIIRSADLAMVFGGQDVVDRYSGDDTVFVNGPGRTKILLTADKDWHDYVDTIVDSVSSMGGMACQNTTAVLYEGDPEPLARAVAERLAMIVPLPSDDERAILPVQPMEQARRTAEYVTATARDATPILGADQVVAEVGDGFAALRPAVHLLNKPNPDVLNVELAFPCVWISPWSRSDGIAPLRRSLVFNAITDDDELIDQLIAEPTIANVYSGHIPTQHMAPQMPHDGYLAEFLMRNKGHIRD
jgi:acyl-CoA reductase-like NAD-dependent aldehyde dehydrogenase